jgi:hypothetical protein
MGAADAPERRNGTAVVAKIAFAGAFMPPVWRSVDEVLNQSNGGDDDATARGLQSK